MKYQNKFSEGLETRLKEAVKLAGGAKPVADRQGSAVSTVYNYMKLKPMPPVDFMYDLSALAKVRPEWLFFGSLPRQAGDETGDWETGLENVIQQTRVPVYEGALTAGAGGVVFEGDPIDYQLFPTDMLRDMGKAAEMHLVPIVGDSMEPELRSGDHAMVDVSQREPREQIFAFNIEGFAMVKRLRLQGGGNAELVSSNPAYPPIPVKLDNQHLIVGRVVWTGRKL